MDPAAKRRTFDPRKARMTKNQIVLSIRAITNQGISGTARVEFWHYTDDS
jgi:hypothetical protein